MNYMPHWDQIRHDFSVKSKFQTFYQGSIAVLGRDTLFLDYDGDIDSVNIDATSFSQKFVLFSAKSAPKENDFRWFFDAMRSTDDDGPVLIEPIIAGINRLIASASFKVIDRVLEAVPTTTAERHALLTLARSTFPIRLKLDQWRPFVSQIYTSFNARSLNADRLLGGLLG